MKNYFRWFSPATKSFVWGLGQSSQSLPTPFTKNAKTLRYSIIGFVFLCGVGNFPGVCIAQHNSSSPVSSRPRTSITTAKSKGSFNLAWDAHVLSAQDEPLLYNGCIYLLSKDGIYRCYNGQTGKVLWQSNLGIYLQPLPLRKDSSSPAPPKVTGTPHAVVSGDTLYVPCSNMIQGNLFAMDPHTGKIKWRHISPLNHKSRGTVYCTPVFVDEKIVFRTGGGLTALQSASGHEVWNVPIDDQYSQALTITGRPTCDSKTIYLGGDLGVAYAFRASNGQRLWSFATAGLSTTRAPQFNVTNIKVSPGRCSPVLGKGRLYLADGIGNLYALSSSSGRLIWQAKIGIVWALAFQKSGLYATSTQGFAQIDSKTGRMIRGRQVKGGYYSLVMEANNQAIVVRNPWANPGWEIINLTTWMSQWSDTNFKVQAGVSADNKLLYVVGNPIGNDVRSVVGSPFAPTTLRAYRRTFSRSVGQPKTEYRVAERR